MRGGAQGGLLRKRDIRKHCTLPSFPLASLFRQPAGKGCYKPPGARRWTATQKCASVCAADAARPGPGAHRRPRTPRREREAAGTPHTARAGALRKRRRKGPASHQASPEQENPDDTHPLPGRPHPPRTRRPQCDRRSKRGFAHAPRAHRRRPAPAAPRLFSILSETGK